MFDINNYDYTLYLCKISDKTPICVINPLDISVAKNFRQFSELSFEISYFDSGWIKVENKTFNLLQPNYLILLETRYNDTLIDSEYFIINQPELQNNDGKIGKVIKCYSSESIFNNRYLTGFDDVRVLYDPNNSYDLNDNTKGGILNYILESMKGIWQVNHISSSLLGVYHSFNYSSQTYRSVIEDLENTYNCVFIFDTINNEINIYTIEEYGEDTEIILSDSNYIKSLSCDIKNSEICTMLKVSGKNNITIAEYNPTGVYLYDFSYFLNNRYLSTSLSSALVTYNDLIDSKEGDLATYLSNLTTLRSNLLTKQNKLVDLNTNLKTIEDSLDVLIDNNRRNTSEYDTIYSNKISVISLITSKENEINIIEGQINIILNNIDSLSISLSLENNFTTEQLVELNYYMFEGNLKLDSVDNAELLYNYAKQYMKIKSTPPYDFTIDLVDLFSINNDYIKYRYSKIKVGNYIYIDCPELGFDYNKYRIIQISHDKNSNNLSITVSNKDKINTELYYLKDLLVEVPKEIDDLKINKEDYSKYVQDSNRILYDNSTINVENNPIEIGSNFINKRGFLGNSLGTRNGAIKIQGDQIVFSKDGDFQEYYAILSSDGLYLETDDGISRVVITPENGFQLDVWNGNTNDYRNAIYLGLDSENAPCLKIDNGFISLTHIESAIEVNKINIDPEEGIKIQKNISGIWTDTFYTDVNGNVQISNGYINLIYKNPETGVDISKINISPELGIVINQWNEVNENWIPVFYTSSSGTIVAESLVAKSSIIQGSFSTGFTYQPRLEIDNNGIISYNATNNKHGLRVRVGAFTDFSLYNNNSPQFLIYDDLTVMDMYAILGDYDPESSDPLKNNISKYSSQRFLSSAGDVTYPYNTWNFENAIVTNLNGYASRSFVESNFASSLSYDSDTGKLTLRDYDGNYLDSVTII